MKWPPHITVATIVENQGSFLFVEELAGHERVLNQPAGHLEPGETLVQAAARETLEESCWEVRVESLIGIYIYHSPHNQTIYHRYCFAGRPLRERNDLHPDEAIKAVHWLTPEALDQHPAALRSPLVKRCLEDYLMGTRYPLDLIQEHG
ncbi:NUDIX hydrolase [Aestuariirhabdus litorea]|uniref:Phosphatase NudJ n=1 Tax=Aestuariirhabdus litorea TaxID=2528527 RepID=A0A3P3VQ99_9GAMM|nr:NUDIX hydrolase [Aestuariirhabdus litorea]RRJ84800.1 NUDIX hydrolase [Aestuariirhabdus litorea]RWW98023.1 NUDIX domain-containing protein [Endozoicomonadaceae bacterium GTF-13]